VSRTGSLRLGLPAVPAFSAEVAGALTEWQGESYYRITDYDAMAPFFISVVSDSDLWMYVSSHGALTAGRCDAAGSLFPYETVDKIHAAGAHTGPKTLLRVHGEDGTAVWQPFAEDGRLRYVLERRLMKHVLGCELWWVEVNRELGLAFRHGWRAAGGFGWVRTAELTNLGARPRRVELLDGVQNLMPAGVPAGLQESMSCLTDAYKRCERDAATGLALYRLSANITDRAEASEALRVTTAWQVGLPEADVVMAPDRWQAFLRGRPVACEADLKGRKGAYLLKAGLTLQAGRSRRWHIALDTGLGHVELSRLRAELGAGIEERLLASIAAGRERLGTLLAGADALQQGGEPLATRHHVANVLFNCARGGVPPKGYDLEAADLRGFLHTRNRPAAARNAAWLAALPDRLSLAELRRRAEGTGDADLSRLCMEYLPLVFSRRHGDPSRPWNRFAIHMSTDEGTPRYAYQGNWRDIFQNWEALCRSYPELLEPIIAKFVNASTPDGFNPYRISEAGVDWETIDPDDPWGSIGYWGDHQIVYLLKLLEASRAHHPGRLEGMLTQRSFTYADVPYDIKPYAAIVREPQNTVAFNRARHEAALARAEEIGSDGRLYHQAGAIHYVTLIEKLLVPILAKLSHLVPGGGIWMNTQRPEWNDANNALVGSGLSVVTLCYLRRHLAFCRELLAGLADRRAAISLEVVTWLEDLARLYAAPPGDVLTDDRARRAFVDAAGAAFSAYRERLTAHGFSGTSETPVARIRIFLTDALGLCDAGIAANRRPDGLFHAYNLLHLDGETARVTHLSEMLEGQVAALSSGLLGAAEASALLSALRRSDLYRADQHSYMLYPERTLPAFAEINRVEDSILSRCPRLARRVDRGNTRVLRRDAEGRLRFGPDACNADALRGMLREIEAIPAEEKAAVLAAYETTFHHKAFTGRSGTMYGYEGIGCIYWHMVAKLLLAAQEAVERAVAEEEPADLIETLAAQYDDIRAGLGFTRSPGSFGAFPLDPYSHTPRFAGAKQPGMTGQVKEEILTRWGELGVIVRDGAVTFRPTLLHARELTAEPSTFEYIDVHQDRRRLDLPAGSFAFTLCQVPVVYRLGPTAGIVVSRAEGTDEAYAGQTLPADVAQRVFRRDGSLRALTVTLTARDLRPMP